MEDIEIDFSFNDIEWEDVPLPPIHAISSDDDDESDNDSLAACVDPPTAKRRKVDKVPGAKPGSDRAKELLAILAGLCSLVTIALAVMLILSLIGITVVKPSETHVLRPAP